MLDITKYKTIVFDADGVILDSNITKIDSYFRTARKLGSSAEQAQSLVDHHITLTGVNSYPKFKWFIETELKEEATAARLDEFQEAFKLAVKRGLMGCRLAEGLDTLRQKTADANWVVVSETDQVQLNILFEERSIADLFDGGIFGTPDSKGQILAREVERGNIQEPALFIGDSRYDHQAATHAGLDFVFMSAWTDDLNWKDYCGEHDIHVCRNIKSL